MDDIVFSAGTIIGYALTGIVATALPIGLLFFWKKYTGESIFPFFVGIAAYYIAATVRIFMRMPLKVEGSIFQSNKLLYCFAQALLSGVLEETARLIAFRYPLRNRTARSTSVMYGIGHDAYESIILTGITSFQFVIAAIGYNRYGMEGYGVDLNSEEALSLYESTRKLADQSFFESLIFTLDEVSSIAVQIALSVIVFAALQKVDWKKLFFLAVGLHTAMDFFMYFPKLGYISMNAAILLDIVFDAAIAYYAYKRYQELPFV